MPEHSLKEKTAKGLLWGGINNGAMQVLNLIFGIITARILNDSDYGMVGMLSIFSLIAGSLQESGFTAALANKQEARHEDYNAVFWFCSGLSLCLYLILAGCAPLIADFYHNEALIPLARYSFLGFFIASLGIPHSAYLFRNLMVKQKALSCIIALIVSGCVGVTMALLGYSYWGIATQSIVYVSMINLCYLHFSPWRPTLPVSFKPLRSMVGGTACQIFVVPALFAAFEWLQERFRPLKFNDDADPEIMSQIEQYAHNPQSRIETK